MTPAPQPEKPQPSSWDTEEEAGSMNNLVTLGIIAAVAIAFLAVCLPLFLLN